MMGLNRLPGLAQVAMQGGAHAAKLIQAKLDEESTANETEPFEYFDKGSMATVSRFNAVVKMGKTEFSGFIAWFAWLGLHLSYLVGNHNRVTTAINWISNTFSRERPHLEFTQQMRVARNVIGAADAK